MRPSWPLLQVADVFKVLVQRLFHRYDVVKVREPASPCRTWCLPAFVARLNRATAGSRTCTCRASDLEPYVNTTTDDAGLPPAGLPPQEHCHQHNQPLPTWIRVIDAPGNWAERAAEKLEASVVVSHAVWELWLLRRCRTACRSGHSTWRPAEQLPCAAMPLSTAAALISTPDAGLPGRHVPAGGTRHGQPPPPADSGGRAPACQGKALVSLQGRLRMKPTD